MMKQISTVLKIVAREFVYPFLFTLLGITLLICVLWIFIGTNLKFTYVLMEAYLQVGVIFLFVLLIDFTAVKIPLLLTLQYRRRFVGLFAVISRLIITLLLTSWLYYGYSFGLDGFSLITKSFSFLSLFALLYVGIEILSIIIYLFHSRNYIAGFCVLTLLLISIVWSALYVSIIPTQRMSVIFIAVAVILSGINYIQIKKVDLYK